jgi:hypothetical protein
MGVKPQEHVVIVGRSVDDSVACVISTYKQYSKPMVVAIVLVSVRFTSSVISMCSTHLTDKWLRFTQAHSIGILSSRIEDIKTSPNIG